MLRALFGTLIVSVCGCGTTTCLSMAKENPRTEVIYGGVRTDVNCILSNNDKDWGIGISNSVPAKCVLKTCSVIDLPLSLAADTLMLPYAIWITIKKKTVPQPELQEGSVVPEPTEK